MKTANGEWELDMDFYGKKLGDLVLGAIKALERFSGKPLKRDSFQMDSLICSIGYALSEWQTPCIENIARLVHTGWMTSYHFWELYRPWTTNSDFDYSPYLDDERVRCCATLPYSNLREIEKDKNRVIAVYLISELGLKHKHVDDV